MHGILFLKSQTFDFFFPRGQVLLVFIRLKITSIDFHKRSFLGRNKPIRGKN